MRGSCCHDVEIVLNEGLEPAAASIEDSLSALGIDATCGSTGPNDFYGACLDPAVPSGMCVGNGWFPDYPSAGTS